MLKNSTYLTVVLFNWAPEGILKFCEDCGSRLHRKGGGVGGGVKMLQAENIFWGIWGRGGGGSTSFARVNAVPPPWVAKVLTAGAKCSFFV